MNPFPVRARIRPVLAAVITPALNSQNKLYVARTGCGPVNGRVYVAAKVGAFALTVTASVYLQTERHHQGKGK